MTDEKQYMIIGNIYIYGDVIWFCKTIAWSNNKSMCCHNIVSMNEIHFDFSVLVKVISSIIND